MRISSSSMALKTNLFGAGVTAALAAGVALGDDPGSRALLERAQRADAFALSVQQSLESARAGSLGPRERLELEALQLDQRQRQDALFYRQQIQTYAPQSGSLRRAEAMRAEQDRQEQLSRFRFDAASALRSDPRARTSDSATPGLVIAPMPRAPADAALVAAVSSANPVHPEPLEVGS